MKNSIFAAIDIGSHNCRLTIFKRDNKKPKILHNQSFGTSLIKNLSYNNEFTDKNTKKTLDCLKKFSGKLLEYNVDDYRCIATEACRQVINPAFFVKLIKSQTGLDVEIISSYEEAQLCLKSCKQYLRKIGGTGLIFDIGGGSTELTFFDEKREIFDTSSISYGVINLIEKKEVYGMKFVDNELRNHFLSFKNKILKKINYEIISIGSCSTITTLCAIFQNLDFFNKKKIEGFEIYRKDLKSTSEKIQEMSMSQLRRSPCIGSRSNLLLNGIEILNYILDAIPFKKVIVTQKGLRDGIMSEFFKIDEKD